MHTQPTLGQAEAYINVHLSRSGRAPSSRPNGPFVTISREAGTDGSTFANRLVPRLEEEVPGESPWTVFDRNLVEEMLQSGHLSTRLARFLPEDKVSEVNASIGELLGLHPNIWSMTQRTNDLMRRLAHTGNVILVGRGANCATEGIPCGLHIRLVASPEFRAQNLARQQGITPEEAADQNIRTDTARRNYVRSVFETDISRANAYDLFINVGTIPLNQAVELAVSLVRSRVAVAAT